MKILTLSACCLLLLMGKADQNGKCEPHGHQICGVSVSSVPATPCVAMNDLGNSANGGAGKPAIIFPNFLLIN
ncbi:MAG: hypothetical protein ACO1OO_03375 [Flavisolibacter sp.]